MVDGLVEPVDVGGLREEQVSHLQSSVVGVGGVEMWDELLPAVIHRLLVRNGRVGPVLEV